MSDMENSTDYVELTVDIVSAYVSNNPVPPTELAQLISRIHSSLTQIGTGQVEAKVSAAPPQPAISIKKSVTADHIVCLEDGRTFKSLKRHLRAKYDMPPDYPMVAPNYAKARSDLAKAIGLGQTRNGNYDEAA